MLDLDNTNLRNGCLIIHNGGDSFTSIPEDGATEEEKAWFEEFRQAFPDGKPEPIIEPGEPVLTTEEKLAVTQKELEETQNKLIETRASLESMNSDFMNFMDYILSTTP